MEFLLSFICIAILGSIISSLIPKGSSEKVIKMITGFVLAFALLTIVIETISAIDWKEMDMDYEQNSVSKSELERQTLLGITMELEAQVKTLVQEYCGTEPKNVRCEVGYEDAEFTVSKIKIYIAKVNKAPLFLYLANRLNVEYSVFELDE